MNIHEYQAKELFTKFGVATPTGKVAETAEEAGRIAAELDGFALLAEIRQSDDLAHVPVIMLTAADDRATRKRAMDAGASDYVTKPFRREHLLMAIKTQLELASDRKAQ